MVDHNSLKVAVAGSNPASRASVSCGRTLLRFLAAGAISKVATETKCNCDVIGSHDRLRIYCRKA